MPEIDKKTPEQNLSPQKELTQALKLFASELLRVKDTNSGIETQSGASAPTHTRRLTLHQQWNLLDANQRPIGISLTTSPTINSGYLVDPRTAHQIFASNPDYQDLISLRISSPDATLIEYSGHFQNNNQDPLLLTIEGQQYNLDQVANSQVLEIIQKIEDIRSQLGIQPPEKTLSATIPVWQNSSNS